MHSIPSLPLATDIETKAVLKQAAVAHRYLAERKGIIGTIPNANILISTLTLQEAKDSSAVENIITTHDELFKADLLTDYAVSASTSVAALYAAGRGSNCAADDPPRAGDQKPVDYS